MERKDYEKKSTPSMGQSGEKNNKKTKTTTAKKEGKKDKTRKREPDTMLIACHS